MTLKTKPKMIPKMKMNKGEHIMKNFIISILSITIVMSMAACSAKAPEQTTKPATTVTNAATSVEPSEMTSADPSEMTSTDTSATLTKVSPAAASEYIQEKFEKVKVVYDVDVEEDEEEYREYCYPQLLIKSSYADKVNKDITKIVERYKKASNTDSEDHLFWGTDYVAFLCKEDVLSLIFISCHEGNCNEYKVYNIDVKTGEKVDNARIAEIAGVSDIRKAAMNALQKHFNDGNGVKLENYKVVLEPGMEKDGQLRNVEKSFSEKYLNDKMRIGLTEEGKMFFISTVGALGGADFYERVYDVNGYYFSDYFNAFVSSKHDDDEDYYDSEDDSPAEDDTESEYE